MVEELAIRLEKGGPRLHEVTISWHWRGGRVAEGARLESVFTGNRNVGSNPTPSATSTRGGESFAETKI